jgi:phospholipase/lecithinase/hemolysin
VKASIRFTWFIVLFGLVVFPTRAAFTSLYVFGDGVSDTTHNTSPYPSSTNFFGLRFSNGRLWIEVLAQQLDLTNNYWYSNNIANQVSYTNLSASSTNWYYSSNNLSYFYHYSSLLVPEVNSFNAPANVNTALFVVWVSDADFVYDVLNYGTNITQWTNAINQSISNHFTVITNFYAKGVRTLVMPDAVDISVVPVYTNYAAAKNGFLRQRVVDFNAAFTVMLSNATTSCPGLAIYEPDFFSLLNNILTNAAAYGLTNAGNYALNLNIPNKLTDLSMTGPGANYIWWDNQDPTAKAHAIMAGVTKQLIASVQISQITSQNGSNQLNLANVPVGLNGVVLGSANLALTNWTTVTNFNSTNTVQPVFVPMSGPIQFYRLYFPFTWTWP